MDDAFLLYGETRLSVDLRHQLPLEMHDPVLFVGHADGATVVTTAVEEPRVRAASDYDIVLLEHLGRDELARELGSRDRADRRAMRQVVCRLGVTSALVPSSFPLAMARELEADGIELRIDDERLAELRRPKSTTEIAGIRRAQSAADAATTAVRSTLAAAERRGSELISDSEPLSVDRLKAVVRAELARHDATLDIFILSHGTQTAVGHHTGAGNIRVGEPIILDLWPTDRSSACCTDMTRTFVVGEPPEVLLTWEATCAAALDAVLAELRPGAIAADLHTIASEVFEAHGFKTPLSAPPGVVLVDGFPYGLGHGVGLSLHEPPLLRQGELSPLMEGEVLAIEPALYDQQVGGYRIENIYLVTSAGPERIGSADDGLTIV